MLTLVVIPFANYGFDHREKYKINSKWIHHLKIPIIAFTIFAITASGYRPIHEYSIRTKSDNHKIDIIKAKKRIENVARNHKAYLLSYDSTEQSAFYANSSLSLTYFILKNDRGIQFKIEGRRGSRHSILRKMELIKKELQDSFRGTGLTNEELEFVVDLVNFNIP